MHAIIAQLAVLLLAVAALVPSPVAAGGGADAGDVLAVILSVGILIVVGCAVLGYISRR